MVILKGGYELSIVVSSVGWRAFPCSPLGSWVEDWLLAPLCALVLQRMVSVPQRHIVLPLCPWWNGKIHCCDEYCDDRCWGGFVVLTANRLPRRVSALLSGPHQAGSCSARESAVRSGGAAATADQDAL